MTGNASPDIPVEDCLGPTFSFLGLRPPESELAFARSVIVPAPYDGTTTYRSGTREGPRAVLQASRELEVYDEETETEPFRHGIHTLDELAVNASCPREMVDRVRRVGAWVLSEGKMPVLVGGEHLLSLGIIQALAALYPDLTVLHLDAHPDLRDRYQDAEYSNACVMRRALECGASLVQVGIRSLTREEHALVGELGIPCFFAQRLRRDPLLWSRIVPALGTHVYISIDLDAFDPSIMPAVGTPEPGGLLWYEALELLRQVCRERHVVGFDVMELMPLAHCPAPDFLAARLVYKLLGYILLDIDHRPC